MVRRLLAALGLIAPTQTMTVSYATTRVWVIKCVVVHDGGTREWFVSLP